MNLEDAHTDWDTSWRIDRGVTQQRSGEAPIVRIMVDLRRPFQVPPLCCNREKWTEYVLRTTCPWLCGLPGGYTSNRRPVYQRLKTTWISAARLSVLSPQLTAPGP